MVTSVNNLRIAYPSPNVDERPAGTTIDMLVLHYTEMSSSRDAIERMCDSKAKVSAHYLIDKTGNIYQLIPDEKRAWHAGISYWRGREGINDHSIGIEIDNNGHEPFPEKQMISVLELSQWLMKTFSIEAWNIVAHSDIAPDRKSDPGAYFDWKWLAEHGVGIMPDDGVKQDSAERIASLGDKGDYVVDFQKRLSDWGYKIKITGEYDKQTEYVVKAFRLHYTQDYLVHAWDNRTDHMLNALLQGVSYV